MRSNIRNFTLQRVKVGDGMGIDSTKIIETLNKQANNKTGERGEPVPRVAKTYYLKFLASKNYLSFQSRWQSR